MFRSEAEFNEVHRILESDIRTLFKLVFTFREPVAEGDIRIASVILRKWLVDRLLLRFCRVAKAKPTFYALDNSEVLEEIPRQPTINYFLTGGIRFNGTAIQGVYNSNAKSTGKPLLPSMNMPEREYSFGKFLRQRRLYFESEFFTCEEIIRYTANKLGGAHLDFIRNGKFQKLDHAAAFMKFGGPLPPNFDPGCDIYLSLEQSGAEILSALHVEIIAAATSFIQLRLNGEPLVHLNTNFSLVSRIKRLLRRNEGRMVIYDYDERSQRD